MLLMAKWFLSYMIPFGFPADLTALIAGEGNKKIDQVAFDEELKKQKERSRAATKLETEDWVEIEKGRNLFHRI
jgi:alanyl-tRNA synthetase